MPSWRLSRYKLKIEAEKAMKKAKVEINTKKSLTWVSLSLTAEEEISPRLLSRIVRLEETDRDVWSCSVETGEWTGTSRTGTATLQ